MSAFSKRAIWQAVNSEHGDRLVQIAKEHIRLARDLAEHRLYMSSVEVEILKSRIEELRKERDAILAQFEGR